MHHITREEVWLAPDLQFPAGGWLVLTWSLEREERPDKTSQGSGVSVLLQVKAWDTQSDAESATLEIIILLLAFLVTGQPQHEHLSCCGA